MKKLILYLFMFVNIFAEDITIKEVMKEFHTDSPFIRRAGLEISKIYKESEGLRTNRNKKVDYRVDFLHETDSDYRNAAYNDDDEELEATISYDPFYYTVVYEEDYGSDQRELQENRIGLKKTINDFIYSQEKYEKRYIKIKDEIVKNGLLDEYLTEAEKIVDAYSKILNIQQSIDVDRDHLEEYRELYSIAKLKEEVGEGLKLEVEYLKAEIMETEERIGYFENLKKVGLLQLSKDIGKTLDTSRDIGNFTEMGEADIRTNDYQLEKLRKEIDMEEENVRMNKRKEQAELTVAGDYDTERELWTISFSLDGSIFDYPLDSTLGEVDVEILKEREDLLTAERDNQMKSLVNEYEHLKNVLEIKRLKKTNREKTVEVMREVYSMGYINAEKLIDEKNDAREAVMEYISALNELRSFEYKMALRNNVLNNWRVF